MADGVVAHVGKDARIHTPRTWVRSYYGSFNGLRAVAVTLVFMNHYGGSLAGYTSRTFWVGVDLFFVLSGFLITGILYDSLESPHYYRDFYVRRALRIFPIFYGFFLLLAILIPILHLQVERGMLTYVFYFGNLTTPFADLQRHNPTLIQMMIHGHLQEVGNIGHLWSLCVEEQFYLLWPAVVWWVRDRRRLMIVCVITSAATLGLRCYLQMHAKPIALEHYLLAWGTYTRFDTLLAGAWLALFLRGHQLSLVQLRRMSAGLFWIPAALLLLAMHHWRGSAGSNSPLMSTVGLMLIALAATGVLLRALDDESLLSRTLRLRPLNEFGKISYGFYLFHGIPGGVLHYVVRVHPALINVAPVLLFVLTTAIAWLSFRYFESPFLRLKSVLAPQRGTDGKVHGAVRVHVSEPRPSP